MRTFDEAMSNASSHDPRTGSISMSSPLPPPPPLPAPPVPPSTPMLLEAGGVACGRALPGEVEARPPANRSRWLEDCTLDR